MQPTPPSTKRKKFQSGVYAENSLTAMLPPWIIETANRHWMGLTVLGGLVLLKLAMVWSERWSARSGSVYGALGSVQDADAESVLFTPEPSEVSYAASPRAAPQTAEQPKTADAPTLRYDPYLEAAIGKLASSAVAAAAPAVRYDPYPEAAVGQLENPGMSTPSHDLHAGTSLDDGKGEAETESFLVPPSPKEDEGEREMAMFLMSPDDDD